MQILAQTIYGMLVDFQFLISVGLLIFFANRLYKREKNATQEEEKPTWVQYKEWEDKQELAESEMRKHDKRIKEER